MTKFFLSVYMTKKIGGGEGVYENFPLLNSERALLLPLVFFSLGFFI